MEIYLLVTLRTVNIIVNMKSRLFLIILLLYGYSIFFSHKTMSYAKEIRNPDFAYTGLLRPQPSKDIPRVLNEIQINDLTSTTDLLYQLQYLPNVQITSYGNPAYANFVSLNRENPKNTLFMLNGVPLNSPLNGSFNLNNIGTNNIAKFEIIKVRFIFIWHKCRSWCY